jgi:hypothetical protein
MKGGNRWDFIGQVDQLIAVRHGGEAVSGPDHREFARKNVQRVEELRFRSRSRMSNITVSSIDRKRYYPSSRRRSLRSANIAPQFSQKSRWGK